MNCRKHLICACFILLATIGATSLLTASEAGISKKPLDHSVYDKWYGIGGYAMTTDGKFTAIYNNRTENDGFLQLINLENGTSVNIDRGSKVKFAPDNKHLICFIRPFYAKQKEAKIKKFKGDKVPKDSLCIMDAVTGRQTKFPMVKRCEIPKDGGNFIAFEARIENDSLKKDGIFIYDLAKGVVVDTLMNLDAFNFNKMGTELYCVKRADKKVKGSKSGIFLYNLQSGEIKTIIEGTSKCTFVRPVLSKEEEMMFFYANTDTTKKYDENVEIWVYKFGNDGWKSHPESAVKVVSNNIKGLKEDYRISRNRGLTVSKDGKRLFFGVSKIMPQKDTAKYQEEKASLDVWHYNDPYIQTKQNMTIGQDTKRSYVSYVNLNDDGSLVEEMGMVQLAAPEYPVARVADEWSADWAYSWSGERFAIQSQWDSNDQADVWIISLEDGKAKMLLDGVEIKSLSPSPEGKYLTWYDPAKKHWFSWNKETGAIKNITEKITVPLWKELHDTPQMAPAYGNGGWRKGDKSFFIYDKYDVWEVDPDGVKEPQMLTQGKGRELGYTFRMIRIKELELPAGTPGIKEDPIEDKESVYFTAFCNKSKGYGYYTREFKGKKLQPMKKLIMEPDYTLGYFHKAKEGNTITFVKSNFVEAPNLWVTKDWFKSTKKLTDCNPQQKDYNWGTVESVYWKAHDGRDVEGLLYKPEDFDSTKKYPMVVYFYEKTSQYKNTYRKPAVSRSTINITYFVSNGYLVFLPDIHYTTGHPGKSAINCIVSGVESLCKNSWVDRENIAIQGQSWGGYQVAYLITQTDMFKCAGSGAPVANMTSAYGGIRWGSGVVRQFQYEHTQSRIGCTLWDEGGLDLYIENSPLFFVDKVKTPVLIMHNDKDEAVPWTQGIEFFTALRRMGKQAWMLQYNNETHNLSGYVNAYDYTIRLSQFMDHFLKGAPMPVWMKYGVPATKKGIDWGLELVEE